MTADLNALQRDVEQARARFANDLARLRSPTNFARFKDDLWAEARETKDELVGKSKEAAKDTAQRMVTELKERAAGPTRRRCWPLAPDWAGGSFIGLR
jgi:hypothetical protein